MPRNGVNMSIYPYIARNVFLPIAEAMEGTSIHSHLKFLEKSQWWSTEELQEYQDKSLRVLIKYAYENVPYYHTSFKETGVRPDDIKNVRDLRKLPIINKEIIRKNFDKFKSKDFIKRKPRPSCTGGSTGEPLKYFYDWDAWSMDWACNYRGFGFAGYHIGDKIVTIGGASLVPSQKPTFKKQIKNKIIERHLMLSAFDMNKTNMNIYLKKMHNYKPKFLRGYPSALYVLAKFIENHGLHMPPIQNAFTTSETLYDYYKKRIESIFSCKVFDNYGCRDGGGNAMECSAHNGLHISVERCVMEFIRANESVAPYETGKIILSDLQNYSFPFIRYEVGDAGVLSDEKCSCGRGLPLIKKLEGRICDIIVTPLGKLLPSEFFPHLMLNFPFVKQYQIIQNSIEHLTINIVLYTSKDEDKVNNICSIIQKYIGEEMIIEANIVNKIETPSSGKRRFVISKVRPIYGCNHAK